MEKARQLIVICLNCQEVAAASIIRSPGPAGPIVNSMKRHTIITITAMPYCYGRSCASNTKMDGGSSGAVEVVFAASAIAMASLTTAST